MKKHVGLFCLLFVFVLLNGSINAQSKLKDEMRFPWATATGDFIRDWLVIGGFPNQDGKGYDTDFLSEHGGESKIQPALGMSHKLPNGSAFEWRNYHSPYNYVNIFDVLNDQDFNNKVIYAFTKINRPADGKVILSFGHNVGNKIWINGKPVYETRSDYQSAENNNIEVDMTKGENTILIKSVHGGWTWGFRFRVIEPGNISLVHDFKLSPSVLKSNNSDRLIIKTDRSLNPEIQKFDVTVKAVAAGGKVASEKTVKRGEQISFDTKKWNDGVYDIRFKSHDNRGEISTAYLYWYKGDAVSEAKELLAGVPKDPVTPDEMIHKMLSEMLIDRFDADLGKLDSTRMGSLYSPLMEYEELKLNKKTKNSNVRANGFVRLAYRDEVDNTPQFCRAYLPIEYNSNKKWPLVVNLHGHNGPNPVYVKWWSVDQRHMDLVDKYPVIDIEPHGRGNTGYEGIGERDVMQCVEMAKKIFNVDEDRIYLKGESMGGGGTWYVGTRHPEVFAAIAPVYGGWDYHVGMSEEQLAKPNEREKFRNEKNSSFAQADALLSTPVFVTHGDIDKSVDVNNSRYAVRMLQRWGYDIRYHEYPGFGHEGIPYVDEVIPWLLEHKRNSSPKTVRVRSADLGSASAHWVKVTQRSNPFSFIETEVEVLINNTIKLSTDNVLEIELSPSGKLIDLKKPVKVVWNVNDIRDVIPADGKIILRDKSYIPSPQNKNPKIEGPISQITTTPFAVVVGTISKDPLMLKLCRQKAQEFIDGWKNWQKYEPRVFNDTEITDGDMKKYSLILFGDAEANQVSKKLKDGIPLRISADQIEINGKVFTAKNACVQMVYPNPLNPERYVSVIGATSGAGMFFYNSGMQDCDYFIQDGCIPNYSLGRPMDKLYIAKGVFNEKWNIDEKYLETGDSQLRKNSPVRKVNSDLTTTIENLPAIDPKVFEAIKGKYEIQPGINVLISIEDGKLMACRPDGKISQLLPISDTEYYTAEEDIQISFYKNENGTIKNMIVHDGRNNYDIKKVE